MTVNSFRWDNVYRAKRLFAPLYGQLCSLRCFGCNLWRYGHLGVLCGLDMSPLSFPNCFFLMNFFVTFPFVGASESTATDITSKWLLTSMRPNVGSEVVGAREAAQTDMALEWLLARVDAKMSCQLVRAGETLGTVVDWAYVRFLRWRLLFSLWFFRTSAVSVRASGSPLGPSWWKWRHQGHRQSGKT